MDVFELTKGVVGLPLARCRLRRGLHRWRSRVAGATGLLLQACRRFRIEAARYPPMVQADLKPVHRRSTLIRSDGVAALRALYRRARSPAAPSALDDSGIRSSVFRPARWRVQATSCCCWAVIPGGRKLAEGRLPRSDLGTRRRSPSIAGDHLSPAVVDSCAGLHRRGPSVGRRERRIAAEEMRPS